LTGVAESYNYLAQSDYTDAYSSLSAVQVSCNDAFSIINGG
jgi:hypothetical protein